MAGRVCVRRSSCAAFGVAMYLAMHCIVLPLSRIGWRLPSLHSVVGELFSHILLLGMVIALGGGARRADGGTLSPAAATPSVQQIQGVAAVVDEVNAVGGIEHQAEERAVAGR